MEAKDKRQAGPEGEPREQRNIREGWPQEQILYEGELDRVKPPYACPTCGEAKLEQLHRGDDDVSVDCASCGSVYVPEQEAEEMVGEERA